jgi:hypothetical protein
MKDKSPILYHYLLGVLAGFIGMILVHPFFSLVASLCDIR